MNAAIRLIAWSLALLLVTLPVAAVLNGWIAADHWPIQRLRLTAEYQRVSAEQVRGAVAPQLGHGFFAIDLEQVQRAVAALPWVDRVEVRKRWPDLIEITLREHRAYARWGADRLLSDRGQLFTASGLDQLQGLPLLDGPDARIGEVVALHRDAQRILTGTGLTVEGLRLSARGSWTLTLANGARVVMGREDPRPRLERLVRVLPQLLAGRSHGFERVDLRYTNGFAVKWLEPAAAGAGAPAGGSTPLPGMPQAMTLQGNPVPALATSASRSQISGTRA